MGSPASAARRASSIATSMRPSVRPSSSRAQSRTAVSVGPTRTDAPHAALRRINSEAGSNRVRRSAHAPIRSRISSAGFPESALA